MPQVKNSIRIKECDNYKQVGSKQFKTVRSADTMLLDGERKKEIIHEKLTEEDILEALKVSIEEKVMPYHMFTYEE